jgi:hypothetical protein
VAPQKSSQTAFRYPASLPGSDWGCCPKQKVGTLCYALVLPGRKSVSRAGFGRNLIGKAPKAAPDVPLSLSPVMTGAAAQSKNYAACSISQVRALVRIAAWSWTLGGEGGPRNLRLSTNRAPNDPPQTHSTRPALLRTKARTFRTPPQVGQGFLSLCVGGLSFPGDPASPGTRETLPTSVGEAPHPLASFPGPRNNLGPQNKDL